jgi:uncharacterized repeat protein (TIGR02543 family)
MTLYAQWSLNTSTHYAVHFNANGGTGKMFDQAIAAGSSADLTANAFSREGYTFTGWNTEANGSGTNYADGATVSGLALAGQTAKLYAQWTPLTNLTLTANAHDGNYWTTFYCGDAGYDITTDGAYAYTAKYDNANSQLTLHKLGTAIAKDEAVIIVSATSPVSMTKGADGTKSTYNDLRGVDVRTLKSTLDNTGTGTFYILSKKDNNFGFFKYTADYMPARKAYLLIPGGNAAPGLTMVFDDETTEIKTTDFTFATPHSQRENYTDKADAWYSLDGRKLDKQPTKAGVYINGSRKVVIK